MRHFYFRHTHVGGGGGGGAEGEGGGALPESTSRASCQIWLFKIDVGTSYLKTKFRVSLLWLTIHFSQISQLPTLLMTVIATGRYCYTLYGALRSFQNRDIRVRHGGRYWRNASSVLSKAWCSPVCGVCTRRIKYRHDALHNFLQACGGDASMSWLSS